MQIFLARLLALFVLAAVVTCDSRMGFRKSVYNHKTEAVEDAGGTTKGDCPNDQYSGSGVVASPNYPGNYGNLDNCGYYLTAPLGYVIQIQFTTFQTEACCDFLYLYDGPSPLISPQIAKLSGQNLAKTVYYSTARWMSMQFTTDATVNFGGWQANFSSVNTATPCNRDLILALDGHSTIGSQANFQKEISFADSLVTNWTVGSTGIQVGPALYLHDEAIQYFLYDAQNVDQLRALINSLGQTSIAGQIVDSMKVAFELVTLSIDTGDVIKDGFRMGIQRVLVMFISFPPNNNDDLLAAKVFTDKILSQGTTIVLVGLNSSVNMTQLIPLSSGPNFVLGVQNVNQLNAAFAARLTTALCQIVAKPPQ